MQGKGVPVGVADGVGATVGEKDGPPGDGRAVGDGLNEPAAAPRTHRVSQSCTKPSWKHCVPGGTADSGYCTPPAHW